MDFEQLKTKVEEWADDKDLIRFEYRVKQFEKVVEEVFELKEEMIQNNKKNTKLEFGDVIVTLIILSNQLNIDFVECLEMAYDKISKRKGKTIDGTFVKEADLK
jgi:NTP pyrophosphatase (non-canonical NTP hydrolase)